MRSALLMEELRAMTPIGRPRVGATGIRALAACVLVTQLTSCAVQPVTYLPGTPCEASAFTVTDDFSGARRGTCTVLSGNHVRLDILPEDEGKINDSPWYAFKLSSASPVTAKISLHYQGGHHRYWPKISDDGSNWLPLEKTQITSSADGEQADIDVILSADPVWIAAQEIVTPVIYDAWNRKTANTTGIPFAALGSSLAGLPIHAFDSNPAAREVLFLVGRQHPPEVSGAIGFFAFAETIFGDSALAREFRARFRVIAIPLLNPDGVVGGNWRYNLAGIDLNRDWGLFTQPETQLVAVLLEELDASSSQLRMFIDFHSTRENVFYTQPDVTRPPDFIKTWLQNARPRISDYPFRLGEGPATNAAIAKNYIYAHYGIPAVTFEVGDETDRNATQAAAGIFAEELMLLMLSQEY